MPQTDTEKLVVTLEARIRDFEKKFAQATRTANKNFSAIEQRSDKAAARLAGSFAKMGTGKFLDTFTSVLKSSALGGLLSFTGAIAGARNALSEFDKTAKAAKNAGLDSDFYQSLAYGADLAGVSLDNLDQALQSFRRNSALAASGKGELVEMLKAVNPAVLDSIRTASTQEQKLRAVADALKDAASETQKIAIATAAFGESGQRLIPVLAGGASSLDDMMRKARDLGIVIDRNLLARSEELTDELSTATRIMNVQFQSALVDLAPVLVDTAKLAAGLARAIRGITDAMRSMENQSSDTLKGRLADLNNTIAKRENPTALFNFDMPGAPSIEDQKAERDRIMAELKRRTLESMRPQLEELKAQIEGPALELNIGGTSRNKSADAAVKQAEAVKALIADLEREYAMIGKSDTERRIEEELRRAGASATAEQRQRIAELVTAIDAETAANEKAKAAAQAHADGIRYLLEGAVGSLERVLMGTESAADAFRSLAAEIAHAALQAALFGDGPLGGLFGGTGILGAIFGFKDGGAVKAASGGLIRGPGTGTSDSIPAQLSDGEYVVNARATRKHRALLEAINAGTLSGFADGGLASARPMQMPRMTGSHAAGSAITINAPITVNGSAGTPPQNADLAQRMQREMERTMRTVVGDEMRKQLRPGNLLNR